MARLDEEIKKDVVDHLYWDDRVDAARVNVEVENGSVTLSGKVPTYLAREAAVDTTRSILGVIDVVNNLRVEFTTDYIIPSDEEIRLDVENMLVSTPDINVLDLKVSVDSGTVTLEGTVDAFWKKLHAEDLISALPGIMDIQNKMAVVPTRSFVDEAVARDVVKTLERNLYVDAEKVNVKVEDGVVTLSGRLLSRMAIHEAHQAALYTGGVQAVNNHLTVEAA